MVLDVVLDRELDGASLTIMNLIDRGQAQGFLSATSCATIYYLANKYLDHHKAIALVKDLLKIFHIIAVDAKVLNLALNQKGPDFEDNIQIACAQLMKVDYIITRDLSHFKNSSVPSLSPSAYELR